MQPTIDALRILVATARLRDDGKVAFSQAGTQNEVQPLTLTLDKLPRHLRANGAFSENIEMFVDDLIATGFAEIRQPKLRTTPFTR
jgi:hypothetical protein